MSLDKKKVIQSVIFELLPQVQPTWTQVAPGKLCVPSSNKCSFRSGSSSKMITSMTYYETRTYSDECDEDHHADCIFNADLCDCPCHEWEPEEEE